jgi:tetratricopeptide (TPR) repeat protein
LRQDRPWIFRFACAALIALIAWGIFTWWRTQQYYHPSPEAFAQYTNGLSLIRQGNYAEATRVLQEALDQDEHFIMAHARLAEAWQNLDFQGNAQHDLLLALPGRSRLPELDRMYLDAIAATVTGDSSGALERYKRILVSLPPSNKSSGYVDLGMAYERVGDIARALDSYSRAAVEDTNNPAAFMHTGILQSRLHHVREGDKAFDRAQAIFKGQVDSYGRQGNPEGLAEVDYERGYAMNDRGDSKGAEVLLERALDEAEKIPSVQLQIRALTQLTSAEYNSYQDAQVVEHAERAIRLARDNQLQSWAANGLVRLATEQMIQGHLKQSEQTLDEAMQILRQSPQPRVLALANSTLANVMDQEDRPDKVAELAQAALDFYKKNGFSEGATAAGQLLVRAKTNEGQYKEALESANEFLAIARQTGAPVVTTQAEEALGAIYLQMERYPDALTHFQNARHLAPTDSLRAYQVLGCAETLWRLGRYSESQTMPQLASGSTALLASVGESRAESLISQQKFGPALALARKVIAENTDMPQNRKLDLEQDEAVVEAHLGMKKQALTDLSAYGVGEAPADNPIDAAHHKLAAAEIYLWVGMNKGAYDSGQAAKEIFASNRQLDSQLRSTYLAAAAAKSLNDDENYRLLSKEISDICQELEQEWGQDFFHDYISRPDLRALIQRAAKRAN